MSSFIGFSKNQPVAGHVFHGVRGTLTPSNHIIIINRGRRGRTIGRWKCLLLFVLLLELISRAKTWGCIRMDIYMTDTRCEAKKLDSEKKTNAPTAIAFKRPTDRCTDGPTDRRTDGPTDRPIDGPTDRPTDRRTDRTTDGPTDRRTDGPTAD